jgi:tripartite-type tricarboxylate transporter receptor subunit TctC
VQSAAFQERLATVGIVASPMSQSDFTTFVANQVDTVGATVRNMGITND